MLSDTTAITNDAQERCRTDTRNLVVVNDRLLLLIFEIFQRAMYGLLQQGFLVAAFRLCCLNPRELPRHLVVDECWRR